MTKIELKNHEAIGVDSKLVEFDQWWVTVDGVNLGLLCKLPESRIMPLLDGNKLSDEQWLPIVSVCSTLAGHVVNPPFHFYVPPDEEQSASEEEDEEDLDDDDS